MLDIDVSKCKRTVAYQQPMGTVIRKLFDVSHIAQDLNKPASHLYTLDRDIKIATEYTDRYYNPIRKTLSEASLFVSVDNPQPTKNFGNTIYTMTSPFQQILGRSHTIRLTAKWEYIYIQI